MEVDDRGSDALEADGALDPARFARLYDDAAPRVFAYIARRLGSERAEDLTAEVFAQAWAGRDRYDPTRSDPVGWVFGIVQNLLRRHHRTAERQLRAYGRVPTDGPAPDPADAVVRQLDARAELAATVRALESLSDLDRDVTLLRAWAGLSYEQISEATGITVDAVRSRLSRARARLGDGRTEQR